MCSLDTVNLINKEISNNYKNVNIPHYTLEEKLSVLSAGEYSLDNPQPIKKNISFITKDNMEIGEVKILIEIDD
ncbi:MAG: hypothetical protein LUH21_04530 [Clostridiales bacterium]|nr:hypothetical protein [Clostridiales bacterium]